MPVSQKRALDEAIAALVHGTQRDPFAILGPHPEHLEHPEHLDGKAIVVRAFQPAAKSIELFLVATGASLAMERVDPAGVFEVRLKPDPTPDAETTTATAVRLKPDTTEETIEGSEETIVGSGFSRTVPDYRLRITYPGDQIVEIDDPYRYGRVLTDFDLHLLSEGTHHRVFEKLGARRITVGTATGVHFGVWAPNADRVSVIGDFNGWDGRVTPMRHLTTGVWEIFIPDFADEEKYKFEIRTRNGAILRKTDPFGRAFEAPPLTAAIVHDVSRYVWRDSGWMASRPVQGAWLDTPMSAYEVHLGSWARVPEEGNRFLTYREMAHRLVPYVKEMGFTHIELLPVMEHPFSGSWGYQVLGFFAPTARFGPPEDFKLFVDACHQAGLGVILDWVPGHFPKDAYGLARFDGTALFEHEDPRQGEHQDWGTLIFNYGRNEVRNFLLSNALFWLEEYHIDGLRVDAVASMLYLDYSRQAGQWIPNQYGGRENLEAIAFLQELNSLTHGGHPGTMTAAEESTSFPGVSRPVHLGGLGFTYKWNMGWMHDTLLYMREDPIHRRWHHNLVTFSALYMHSENYVLPFSHDEVVHGKRSLIDKMPGDAWQKYASLRLLYGYMYGHPGKKLLFMGGEFAQWREWNHDRSLDWHLLDDPAHAAIKQYVRDLNRLYQAEPALHEADFEPAGFRWIDANDNENSVVSIVRYAKDHREPVVMVFNFTPVARMEYRIGVPDAGFYEERLNSDASVYGGSNVGNLGGVPSEPIAAHGFDQSVRLTVPPLGCLLLKKR
jgi:1,4-alpha-glucan branching enzyme